MAELVIKLVNGELAGKTMQGITKEVNAAALALKKAEIGTQAWVDANKKLEDTKKLQGDLKKQIESTTAASDQLKQAWNKLPGAQYFNQVVSSFNMMKQGVGGLVSQFGVLKTAIAATGIGLLVIAFSTLVAWFQKTDEGATLLSGIMKGLGVVMDTVFGGMIDLFKGLAEYFNGKKSLKQGLIDLVDFIGTNLMNRVKSFLVIWEGITTLDFKKTTDGLIQLTTGVTDATDKMLKFGESVANAVNEGIEFEKELDRIEDAARRLSVTNAESEKTVAQLILQSKNVGLTFKERIALLDKASAIELNNHQQQLANARDLEALRAKEIADNKKRNIETDELDQALADAQIARISLEKESITLQEKIANRRTALTEKEVAEQLKAAEDIAKANEASAKEQAKAWEEYYATLNMLEEQRISSKENSRDRDLELLNLSLQKQIEAIDSNAPFYAERMAAASEMGRQKRKEINQKWDAQELDEQLLADQNIISERLLNNQISEEQFRQQTAALVLQNSVDKLALLKAAHGEESAEYQRAYAEYLKIQQAAADASVTTQKKLSADQAQALQGSLTVFGNVFGALAGMQEQGTQKWKQAATAQAIISTIQGAINAYSSTAAIPIVGGVLAPLAASAALAAGYAQVNKIRKTEVKSPLKAEIGGFLVGPRHSSGGIQLEAEGGEFIFSRKAVAGIGVHNLNKVNDHFTRRFEAGGPVNPFNDRAPVTRSGSTPTISTANPNAELANEFRAFRAEITTWQRTLKVVNLVSDTEKGIKTLNTIKSDANV